MSWNLHFEIAWREGGPVPVEIRKKAGRVLQGSFEAAKNLGLIALEPSDDEPLHGFVQILFRDDSEADFAILLGALQRLAREEPGLRVTASDELYLTGEDVLEVGEPRHVISPDHTGGTGVFRARSGAAKQVHRAEIPRLSGRDVARAFLAGLSAKRLVAWRGPEDHAIEQLAALVEVINGSRWRGAKDVLRVLEEDPAVDEVFATDRQLDDLWRQAVNR
ncbi:Hypothetical protein A7982_08033 [Minicystis rosea]|nr:Hypothetical protein A7982_08033 [Minicystis rosea]